MIVFCETKAIVSINEHLYHRLQGIYCPCEAAASPCQNWNVVAQIRVYTFNYVRIAFVCHVSYMFAWKNDIQIANISVCTVFFRLWRLIYDALYANSTLVPRHLKAHDLSWTSTHHRHQVDVFPCFGVRFLFDKPVQLIKFKTLRQVFNIYLLSHLITQFQS